MKLAFVSLIALVAISACNGASPTQPNQPNQYVEAGVIIADGACTALEGVTDNGIVKIICAYTNEIGAIADFITRLRAEAGASRKAGEPCVTVGTVCATRKEIAAGIDFTLQRRAAVLKKDAGL